MENVPVPFDVNDFLFLELNVYAVKTFHMFIRTQNVYLHSTNNNLPHLSYLKV